MKITMITKILTCTIVLLHSASAVADEQNTNALEAVNTAQQVAGADDLLKALEKYKTGNPIIDTLLEEYTAYIRGILASTRGLQDLVFKDANELIESSIAFLESDEFIKLDANSQKKYIAFQEEAAKLLIEMAVLSSDEGIADNEKAFKSIGPRLSELKKILNKIKGSQNLVAITQRTNQFTKLLNDTESDYRFLKRFNAGVGISYSYLPEVRYTGVVRPDLDRYLPLVDADTGNPFNTALSITGEFAQDFSNTSYPSITFSAHMDFISATVAFPFYNDTKVVNATDSQRVQGDTNQRLIAKNTVSTEFKPLFEAGINLSAPDLWQFIKKNKWLTSDDSTLSERLTHQIDFGLHIGVTAFQLEDTFTSDIRMVNQGLSFVDSVAIETVTQKVKRNLRPISFGVYLRLEPADALSIGFDLRYYENDSDGDFVVDVSGTTATVNVTYLFY